MNWTGGHLQRHSTAATSAKDRQKQHFAKIRQILLCPVKKKSPIKLGFCGDNVKDCGLTTYSSLAPTRSPISSICSNQFPKKTLRSSPEIGYRRQRKRLYEADLSNTSPVSGIKRKCSKTSKNHLHMRKPALKPKVRLSICRSPDDHRSELQKTEGNISLKKRKILKIQDWIGISMRRPSPLKYESPIHDESVDCKLLYNTNRHMPDNHPTSSFSREDFEKAIDERFDENSTSPSHSTEVFLSIDTNLVQNRDKDKSIENLQNLSKTCSDKMLLDNENDQRQASSLPVSSTTYELSQDQHHLLGFQKIKAGSSVSLLAKKHGTRKYLNSSCQFEDNSSYSTNFSAQIPIIETESSKKTMQAVPHKYPQQSGVFFASSAVCLQHPMPRSSRFSCLLRTESSNEKIRCDNIVNLDPDLLKTDSLSLNSKQFIPFLSDLDNEALNQQKYSLISEKSNTVQDNRKNRYCYGGDDKIGSKKYNRRLKVGDEGKSLLFRSESYPSSLSSVVLPEKELAIAPQLKPCCNGMTRIVKVGGAKPPPQSNDIKCIGQRELEPKSKDTDEVWKTFIFGSYLHESDLNSKEGL